MARNVSCRNNTYSMHKRDYTLYEQVLLVSMRNQNISSSLALI